MAGNQRHASNSPMFALRNCPHSMFARSKPQRRQIPGYHLGSPSGWDWDQTSMTHSTYAASAHGAASARSQYARSAAPKGDCRPSRLAHGVPSDRTTRINFVDGALEESGLSVQP